ncbi:hypothetical protein [Comamonas sp. AG1104]|uniref:hypothetical protein n=1 Tax=Comamonas sp. AG1104 TaxID=2183900 RepID=UPI000E2B5FAA|nr:hypothetical protein [Comamonas sp. AG1104]RDI10713.1 hypothetical protein DFO48_105226 [Comamonas sp. AG1104]
MQYDIRQLNESDLCNYRALRLQALTECPAAFGATPATEQALGDAQLLSRFSGAQGQAMWGGFGADGRLCSSLGLYRDQGEKTAHKGHLFAMYVAAPARGQGLACCLLPAEDCCCARQSAELATADAGLQRRQRQRTTLV